VDSTDLDLKSVALHGLVGEVLDSRIASKYACIEAEINIVCATDFCRDAPVVELPAALQASWLRFSADY
jgi:hypothetical protein